MKRLLILGLFLTFSLQSCSEDDTSASGNTNTTSGFTWKENNGAEIKADSAYYIAEFKTIKAFKNYSDPVNSKFIEINLTGGTPATYDVSNGNDISFLYSNNLYVASTGTVIISENSSNKMTGTFTSTSTNGTVTSLEGSFKSIEIR